MLGPRIVISGLLLRIVAVLIIIVLIFQYKLLKNVAYITYNLDMQQMAASLSLPPPSPPQQQQSTTTTATNNDDNDNNNNKYQHCPFKDSSLFESIYVYPHPGTPEFTGNILSKYGQKNTIQEYPWMVIDERSRKAGIGPYEPTSQLVQYNTELLVRDIITHPQSCLRTYDPEKAKLFYVPYLPAAEFHNGTLNLGNYGTTRYGQALMDIIRDGKYDAWETAFGLTSKYWKRKNGADHIMVYSEPMHGLWHPRSKRGNYHFINSQYQLRPPIAISVELSTTFVDMYPNCARKNILMPYPNTDGKFFNGIYDQDAINVQKEIGIVSIPESDAASMTERRLDVERRKRDINKRYL